MKSWKNDRSISAYESRFQYASTDKSSPKRLDLGSHQLVQRHQ